jgi:ssDNA-binding replication factor A large subunit
MVVGRLITGWAKRINPPRLLDPAMGDIASIRANQNATFSATIVSISAPREVTNSRGTTSVADATIQDATGTTTLTLWGEDIAKYKAGMKIQITDGWVRDYKGKPQVSLGRSGKITVLP